MADDQENGPDMAADTARQETEVGGGNLENEEQSAQQQQPLHAEPGILSEALVTIGHGIATPPQERAPPAVVAHLDSNEQPIDTSGSIEDTCEALSKVEKILERLTQGAGLLANYGDEQKVAETTEYGGGEEEEQQQQPKAPDTPFISPFERFYFNKPGAPSTATLPTSEPSDESSVPNEPSSKTFTPPALTPIEETEHVAVAAAAPEKNEGNEQQQPQQEQEQEQQQQPEERIEENETPEKQEEKDDGNQQLLPGIDEGVAENQLPQSPAQQVAEESGDSAANEENETRNEESESRVNKELVDDDRVESEKEDAKTYEAPTQDIGEPELQREEDEGDSPRQPIDNENENVPPPPSPPTETQEDLVEEGGAQDAANTKESEGIEESTPVVETDADVHLICAPAKSSTDNVDEQDDFTTPQRSLGSKKTSIELTIEQKPTDAEERDESAAEYIVVKEEESQEDALEAVSSVSPISDESYDIVESSLGTGE